MNDRDLEKYSSAVTLSDMEVFVFPELMYSLVLANIMSPVIWRWRELECFKKLEGKSSYKKLLRLRQFIMDEFDFNLDLETWGLTRTDVEIKRFADFVSPEQIAVSNALFGYTGDKYYFDVDIRQHFGLNKYNSEIIPYWKTETVEAMQAFRRKPGYKTGAGECVSLSALYAAAAFVVCGVPLEDIFMVLTPLHSQNFIDLQDGILTNNRRLLTKTMWFNGTAITSKAQRALRNERVTVVAHNSGYVHCLYNDATIDRKAYERFVGRLRGYLTTDLNMEVFASFLRCYSEYQKYFQLCRDCHGQPQYLRAEVLFQYEHDSDYKIGCRTHEKLLAEVSDEDFLREPMADRIRCDRLEGLLRNDKPDVRTSQGRAVLGRFVKDVVPEAERFVDDLAYFVHCEPNLPGPDKKFIQSQPIMLSVGQSREQIIECLSQMRDRSTTADLAFYAYRDMSSCDWRPFVKAAVERSPVSLEVTKDMSVGAVYSWLEAMDAESIYDGQRLAQPDEVANYMTGDGLEKAVLLANMIRHRRPGDSVEIVVEGDQVTVKGGGEYKFGSAKGLRKRLQIAADGTIRVD